MPDHILIALIFGALVAGIHLERARARWAWRDKRKSGNFKRRNIVPLRPKPAISPAVDAIDQLRVVMDNSFEKRRLMSKAEADVFRAAERAIKAQNLPWRVMAQVSLGEFLSSPEALAYRAINSKRVDMLIVGETTDPIAAIEYQGSGHYLGNAPVRDAVKKEALRKAGIGFIEITPEHGIDDLVREISRIANVREGRRQPENQISPPQAG